jgi:hypothetical protein
MKIIDTTLFWNEFDILELRLAQHYDYVDKIVIVECDRTYSGLYKGFTLETQLNRYTKWWDKVQHIKVSNSPTYSNPWDNEHWQRDHMMIGWQDVGKDDVILLSDLDEIVRPEAFEYIRNTNYDLYGLFMPAFYFKFNYVDAKPDWHYKVWGRAFRGGPYIAGHRMRYTNDIPGRSRIALHHAGWHFGWMGDENFAKYKVKSFSHNEYNQPHVIENFNIEKHISDGTDHIRPHNVTWHTVNLDEYFPKIILDNKEKYANLILPDSGKTVQDYWPGGIIEPTEWK